MPTSFPALNSNNNNNSQNSSDNNSSGSSNSSGGGGGFNNKTLLVTLIVLVTFALFSVLTSPSTNSSSKNSKSASSKDENTPDDNFAGSSPTNQKSVPPKTISFSDENNNNDNNKKSTPSSSNSNLMPRYADELFNMTQSDDASPDKKVPPFLVRPARRGNDLTVRWKCSPRKIGPFHVDSPSTPWPNCRMLDHDTEMRTFQYLTERLMCGLPVFGAQSEKWISLVKKYYEEKQGEAATGPSFTDLLHYYNKKSLTIDDDASMKSHRPLRVLQVGANTGSNQNDPLVKLLMGGYAQAVLLEPVPWIFEKLHETYSSMAGMIALVQAAVSNKDGSTTFMAPKPSMQAKGPWLHQMGGLNLPPRSYNRLKRMGLLKEFKRITVASLTITTVLNKFAPWIDKTDKSGGLPPPPDVVVIDAEGFDAVIVNQILDYVQLLDEAGRATEDGETVSIIQYENKHVPKRDNARLMDRLVKMGYSVTEVYVDTVAVRTGRGAFYEKGVNPSAQELEKRWPSCDHGFSLERR